jgi:hypothetical protein
MTDELKQILFGIAFPFAFSLAAMAAAFARRRTVDVAKPSPHPSPGGRGGTSPAFWPWQATCAVGVPLVLAYILLYGMPALPEPLRSMLPAIDGGTSDTWRTAVFPPLVGLIASIPLWFAGSLSPRASGVLFALAAIVVAGLTPWLIYPYLKPEPWAVHLVAPVAALAVIAAVEPVAARRSGPSVIIALGFACAAAAGLILMANFLKLSIPMGALAMAMLGVMVIALLRRGATLSRGPLLVIVPATITAVLFAWLNHRFLEGPIPIGAFALVALSPVMLWAGEWPPNDAERRATPANIRWLGGLARIAAVLLTCAAGLAWAMLATNAAEDDAAADDPYADMYEGLMGE